MKRRPEPELMDEAEQALAYAEADFSEPDARFIELFAQQLGGGSFAPGNLDGTRALDLGCGPGNILLRFLRAYPGVTCDGLDGSAAMLAHAQAALDSLPGLAHRARLICESLPTDRLEAGVYDVVLSNSLLHHLHEPQVLWQTMRRVGRPGALVQVVDLMRPASAGWAEALVATYADGAPEVLRNDFRNSLFAAFEPQEVVTQLHEAGLDGLAVAVISDRHLAVLGRLPGG
jgi:SAM-dependent methyltransferase